MRRQKYHQYGTLCFNRFFWTRCSPETQQESVCVGTFCSCQLQYIITTDITTVTRLYYCYIYLVCLRCPPTLPLFHSISLTRPSGQVAMGACACLECSASALNLLVRAVSFFQNHACGSHLTGPSTYRESSTQSFFYPYTKFI